MNKLIEITQKIVKSQSEDAQLALIKLKNAMESVEFVKQQLETVEILSKKQAEEISYLTKRNEVLKRTRIFNISISGLGLILGTTGYFLKRDPELKDIGNIMFYTGIGLTSSGVISFVITIPF